MAEHSFHIRSISMPSTSQPSLLKVEDELKTLGNYVSSSTTTQMMCKGLKGVSNLYDFMEELLRLPSSQHSLQSCQKKWVEDQLDSSLKLLDLICAVKVVLLASREHVQALNSALWRKQNIAVDLKKKAQKMIKDCLKSLKQIDQSPCSIEKERDDELVKVLIQAQQITKSLIGSVLNFLSQPKTKTTRWSIICKAMSKRKVSCEFACQGSTEKEKAQFWLSTSYDCMLMKDADDVSKVQKAHDDLEELELRIGCLESGLECLFKQLIQYRVSLLNIISL